MSNLNLLREELAAIQSALAEDALEHLSPLVERYHIHLNAWMATGIREAGAPLHELHQMHHQVITGIQQCQQRLRTRMQSERHGSRAARAYLSETA